MSCLQVVIEKSRLKVGVKGSAPVLDGELFAAVKPDDCYWNIADGKVLEITMQKVSSCCVSHDNAMQDAINAASCQ